MANKFGWNNTYSKDNLLVRLLNLFYVIPPVVNETPVARQRSLMMRFNLPVSRAQRFSSRARVLSGNKEAALLALPVEACIGENADATFVEKSDNEFVDSESDPARSLQLGSGPGAKSFSQGSFCPVIGLSGDNCCRCACDCCRRSAREWLLPRAAGSYLPLKQAAKFSNKRLRLIRDPGDCVLGVLSCGYVLSGSGSVKSGLQKRA